MSVFVAKNPSVKPVLNDFERLNVNPESLARYLPPDKINLTPSYGVSQMKFKCPVNVS